MKGALRDNSPGGLVQALVEQVVHAGLLTVSMRMRTMSHQMRC